MYNLARIMKRAWELKKENKMNIFSFCLRMAWSEEKGEKVMTLDEKVQKVIEEFVYEVNFKRKRYFQQAKRWTKDGKDRLYIPRDAYEQAGYIDLVTMECHPTRGGNLSQLKAALAMLNEAK